MSMTIGRAAIAEDPYAGTLQVAGDRVSFESDIAAASVDECKARMQQLAGLVGNVDEPVIPFTWTEDPTFDGFYRVRGVSLQPNAATLATGVCPFRVDLEKVAGGFAKPRFETIISAVERSNGIVAPTPTAVVWSYFAPSGYGWNDIDASALGTLGTATLTTDDGSVVCKTDTSPSASALSAFRFVKPADFYKGSVRVEIKYGSTWYPVHGQQIPNATAGDWRISNGYCRVYPSAGTGYGRFTVETYRSGSWYGRECWIGGYDTVGAGYAVTEVTGDSTGFTTPTVLANSPRLAVVRCSVGLSTIDFAVRAGTTWVEATHTSADPSATTDSVNPAAGVSGTVASTSSSGRIYATSNDANGLRYLIASTATGTYDTTNGRMYRSGDANPSSWMFTADYQAGIATTAASVHDLFLYAVSSVDRVVAR